MADDTEQSRSDGEPEANEWLDFKGLNIFFAVVVGLAIIGFFVGTYQDPYDAKLAGFAEETDRPEGDAEPARAFHELMDDPYMRNLHWMGELDRLGEDRPAVTDEVERTDEMFEQALVDRRQNRAYEGAPPTVPHPIREQGYQDCMACHGEGVRIDDRLATPISHDYMPNCTQCHVPDAGSIPAEDSRYDELPLNNDFEGLNRWGPAERAHDGAPPTNPHPTQMREDCASCHGTTARPGLRTTHPYQPECQQCHAPTATLDQHPQIPGLQEVEQP